MDLAQGLIGGLLQRIQKVQNDRNAIERCPLSGPKKLTKTYNKGFPNHSTLINYGLY